MSRHLDGTGSAHPIIRFLDVLERELDDLVDAPTWSLDAPDTTQVVGRLVALEARLEELEARTVRHAETLEVPAAGGFRSTDRVARPADPPHPPRGRTQGPPRPGPGRPRADAGGDGAR